jgi:1,2-diacylglycerol 3-alpha-glucosyltransferase
VKILVSSTTYAPALNGQSIFTTSLAENLAMRGHQVMVITQWAKGQPYEALRNQVQVVRMPSISMQWIHNNVYFSIFVQRGLKKALASFHPEIIHIQDHFPLNTELIGLVRKDGIGLVGTNHFMPQNIAPYVPGISLFRPLFNRVMWGWAMRIYNRLDVVTAQSQSSVRLLQENGLRVPAFQVSCGLDTHRFHPDPAVDRAACRQRYGLDAHKKVFLFVGRVDGEKRIDVLLRAMQHVQREDIQFVVAGDGAAGPHLKALAQALDLGERVHFTGFVPNEDLPNLLNSVDVFTMPSEAELLSIATLEAMACARPLLLADAVALPELVEVGENGYLFKPGDPLDAAHWMEQLAEIPERWAEMGQKSRQKAEAHSLENTIRQYETIYTSLLAGERPVLAR